MKPGQNYDPVGDVVRDLMRLALSRQYLNAIGKVKPALQAAADKPLGTFHEAPECGMTSTGRKSFDDLSGSNLRVRPGDRHQPFADETRIVEKPA